MEPNLTQNELKEILRRWNTGQTITNEEINILVNYNLLDDNYILTRDGRHLLFPNPESELDPEYINRPHGYIKYN